MKDIFNEWYEVLIIILVGIGGFLLGGLFMRSLHGTAKTTDGIHLVPLEVEQQNSRQRVYASKRGKRYYPWWCNAGNTIAKKNKIWYETAAQAKAEGYTLAKGCQ